MLASSISCSCYHLEEYMYLPIMMHQALFQAKDLVEVQRATGSEIPGMLSQLPPAREVWFGALWEQIVLSGEITFFQNIS